MHGIKIKIQISKTRKPNRLLFYVGFFILNSICFLCLAGTFQDTFIKSNYLSGSKSPSMITAMKEHMTQTFAHFMKMMPGW